MAADYVDRAALRTALFDADAITMRGIFMLNQFPAADVVEQKHGKWIKADDGFDESWVCSECMEEYVSVDADFIDYAHYCPNCGARNDGV